MTRSRIKFLIIVALLGIPLLVNYLSTAPTGRFSDVGQPTGGVLQAERADLDGDGTDEVVRLAADATDLFSLENVRLEVQDTTGTITVPIDAQGYSAATLNVIQMNGQPGMEVFVTFTASGSGGLTDLYGFRFGEGKYQTLFSPKHYLKSKDFEIRYLGERKIDFRDLNTGLKATLDLSENPNYADFTEAELERAYNSQKTWMVDRYSGFSWANLTGDDTAEIIGSRAVTGMAQADLIGTLQDYYRLEGEEYRPYAQAFFAVGGEEVAGQVITGEREE